MCLNPHPHHPVRELQMRLIEGARLGIRPLCYRAPSGPPERSRLIDADRACIAAGIASTPFVSPPVLDPADVRAQLDAIEAARGRDVVSDPLPDSVMPATAHETSGLVSADASDGARGDSQAVAVRVEGPSISPEPPLATHPAAMVAVLILIMLLAAAVMRQHHEEPEYPGALDASTAAGAR
jgi:hypothetical protein